MNLKRFDAEIGTNFFGHVHVIDCNFHLLSAILISNSTTSSIIFYGIQEKTCTVIYNEGYTE